MTNGREMESIQNYLARRKGSESSRLCMVSRLCSSIKNEIHDNYEIALVEDL